MNYVSNKSESSLYLLFVRRRIIGFFINYSNRIHWNPFKFRNDHLAWLAQHTKWTQPNEHLLCTLHIAQSSAGQRKCWHFHPFSVSIEFLLFPFALLRLRSVNNPLQRPVHANKKKWEIEKKNSTWWHTFVVRTSAIFNILTEAKLHIGLLLPRCERREKSLKSLIR